MDGHVKTNECLRTHPPDSRNSVCSCCAKAPINICACDFRNGCSQKLEIDAILLYQSHKQEPKAVPVGHPAFYCLVPQARALICGFASETHAKSLDVHWIHTYRHRFRCEFFQSRPIAVTPFHVDDMSCGSLRERNHVLKSVVTQSVVGKKGGKTSRFNEKTFRQDGDSDSHIKTTESTARVRPNKHNTKLGVTHLASESPRLKSAHNHMLGLPSEHNQIPLSLFAKILNVCENALVRELTARIQVYPGTHRLQNSVEFSFLQRVSPGMVLW